MKLYNFSIYAERRDAIRKEDDARTAVLEVVAHIEKPGAVVELKHCVDGWFGLHQQVLKKVARVG